MSKKVIILIIAIIILVVAGFFWYNYQKTEKQYKACLDLCNFKSPTLEDTGADSFTKFMAKKENDKCQAFCREKYAK